MSAATVLQHQNIEGLKTLRLNRMAASYEQQSADKKFSELSFDERLNLLVTDTIEARETTRINTLLKNAALRYPSASLDQIEYFKDRGLDCNELAAYAAGSFLGGHENIVFQGATGSGKTFIACAVAASLCRKGVKVRYVRFPDVLEELETARLKNTFGKALDAFTKPQVLVLDEFLLVPPSTKGLRDLFEITEKRAERGSTIFCSQFGTGEWYERMGTNEPALKEAILDRIVHATHHVFIGGDCSMRERHTVLAPAEP